MKLHLLLVTAAAIGTLPNGASGQQVRVNEQYQGPCAGATLSSYTGWMALASGINCGTQGSSGVDGLFTTFRSTATIDWTFLHGPVALNGLYFSGSGTFYLDLMDGSNVLQTRTFTAHGVDIFIESNWGGDVSRVRIRRKSGTGLFGLGKSGIVLDETSQNGNDGVGGPGGTGGEGGAGGPGDEGGIGGPGGNGGAGGNGGENGDDPKDVERLVNQTNSTPEPATLLLVASGLGGVGALARRRRRQNSAS